MNTIPLRGVTVFKGEPERHPPIRSLRELVRLTERAVRARGYAMDVAPDAVLGPELGRLVPRLTPKAYREAVAAGLIVAGFGPMFDEMAKE